MKNEKIKISFKWDSAEHTCAHAYLMPAVLRILEPLKPRKIFDLGCGNGSVANALTQKGYRVVGVDPSPDGIRHARKAYPHLKLYPGSAYDPLARKYGRFPVVMSLEVVEHVFLPRSYAQTLFDLLEPGGTAIVSTPFHGYWKNLAIALTGGFDKHVNPLWDYGHIKFWSMKTLSTLLTEAGFEKDIHYRHVGRIPGLAKSMVAVAKKPLISGPKRK